MILTDSEIVAELASGNIEVDPCVDARDIRPTGIRLHLSNELLMPKPSVVDVAGDYTALFNRHYIDSGGFMLRPGDFVLAASIQKIRIAPHLIGFLDGRSTLARLGLMVHCTAKTVDNLHSEARTITFELANLGKFDLILRAGIAVAQLSFMTLVSSIYQAASSQYQNQRGVTPPRPSQAGRVNLE